MSKWMSGAFIGGMARNRGGWKLINNAAIA